MMPANELQVTSMISSPGFNKERKEKYVYVISDGLFR